MVIESGGTGEGREQRFVPACSEWFLSIKSISLPNAPYPGSQPKANNLLVSQAPWTADIIGITTTILISISSRRDKKVVGYSQEGN